MLRATFRSLLARKLRLLLSATAIVLGVSFVAGALTLTDTLGKVFDNLFTDVSAKTSVVVRGTKVFEGGSHGDAQRLPVPARLLTTLRSADGVAGATGDVSGYAALLDRKGKVVGTSGAPVLGVNYDANPATSGFTLRAGRAPVGPTDVALDATTAKESSFAPGDPVTVLLRSGRRTLTVSGVFGFGKNDNLAGAKIIAFGQAIAEEELGRPGEYDVVRLSAVRGVSDTALRDRVRALLPRGTEAVTGQESASETSKQIKDALGFFNVFLLVFAAVALFVGAFLIFNTFNILVAQRQRELALLRALGASRGQVTRSVLVEGLVVGLLASAIGLGAGVGVAAGLRALISSFGGALPSGPLIVTTRTVIAAFAVGILVTLLASLLPARRASAVPPVAAMRDAAIPESSLRRSLVIGSVLLLLGVLLVAKGLTGNLPLLGVGALLSFLGVAGLSPLLSRPASRLLGWPLARGVPGKLGQRNAMRNPRRTASTAAALMIGLALVSAVSVLGASTKASVVKIVEGAVGADLVVQQKGFARGFSPTVTQSVRSAPGVARVDVLRFEQAKVGSAVTFVTAVPAESIGRTITLTRKAGDLSLSPSTLLLSDKEAKDRALRPGDSVQVTFGRGSTQTLRVAGTYLANQLVGPYLLDQSASQQFTNRLDSVLLVEARKGVSADQVRASVDRVVAAEPTVEVLNRAEFTKSTTSQIDTVTTIITILLGLSILIAVLGIVNTLALAVIERTHELGLLRAVGLSRRQTRRMVTVEAVIVSVFGALLGIGVGSVFGIAFQRALADQGIDQLSFPAGRLVVFVVVAGLAGVLAALLPARRAARLDVLRAIATT